MDKLADSNISAIVKAGLRSIATSIPIAGSFAQAWSEYESHAKSQRLDQFFDDMREIAAAMQGELTRVKQQIEGSGEFAALLEKTLDSIQREVSVSKRRLFAQVLLNNVAAGNSRSYDDKTNLLDLLDDLNESDLVVLAKFDCERSLNIKAVLLPVIPEETGAERNARLAPLVISLTKLESRGLITETKTFIQSQNSFDGESRWDSKWEGKHCVMLPFGKMLLDSLKEKSPHPTATQLADLNK
jgi:hypothetical protein